MSKRPRLGYADDAFRVWGDFDAVKFTNWVHTPTPEKSRQTNGLAIHASRCSRQVADLAHNGRLGEAALPLPSSDDPQTRRPQISR